jgi:hypothetical protein
MCIPPRFPGFETSMKLFSPAAERNGQYIVGVLKKYFGANHSVVEVAAGTGQHAVLFAEELRAQWQPTDASPDAVASINAYRIEAKLSNLAAAKRFDVVRDKWPFGLVDGIVNINMIHISPWQACEQLVTVAEKAVVSDGYLIFYGPFLEDDLPTAPSNVDFDRSLQMQNPAWGVRRKEAVRSLCEGHGFDFVERVELPANNLSLVFRRRP